MDSILNSIKKLLGISLDETHFDDEVIMHINSALMTLSQIGVGTDVAISSEENTWNSIIGDSKTLEGVKLHVYLNVRLTFDPPTSSFVLDSIERQINKLEFRLNVQAENSASEVT